MNFWKFGVLEFYKMNPEFYEYLETWHMRIFKNEFGILRIFLNLVYGNFKK